MEFMSIFSFLLCMCIPGIYCGEEQNVSTSQVATNTPEIQLANTMKSTPEEIPIESAKPQKQPSIPLKVVKKKKKGIYDWPLEPNSIHLERGDTLVNLCPAETEEQKDILKNSNYKYCLFIQDKSATSLGDRMCEEKLEPKLWNVKDGQDRCGEKGKGGLYTYNHQVCWKSNSIMTKVAKLSFLNWKTLDERFPEIRQDFIEVYTACCLYEKETIYVKFTLVPANNSELSQALEDRELQKESKGFATLDFQRRTEMFQKEKQEVALHEMFGDKFDDHLIPQMLASPKLVAPLLARNSLYSYLNIAPQWASIEDHWQMLEEHIRQVGLKYTYNIFIFAGIQGKITKDEKPLSIKVERNTFDVPSVWWKLLINKDYEEGILIAMQNEPKKFPNLGDRLCNESICNSNGWQEIDKFAYCCEFNEDMQKLLDLHMENFTINKVFNPKTSIEERPQPKPKPRNSKSRVNEWFKKAVKRKPKSLI